MAATPAASTSSAPTCSPAALHARGSQGPGRREGRRRPAPVADPPPPPSLLRRRRRRGSRAPPAAETGWWGVQDLAQGVFVGSAIGLRADLIGPVLEDDAKLLKRDLICPTDAQAALKTAAFGEIHVPFSF
jgi:anti-sigma factor RsiW